MHIITCQNLIFAALLAKYSCKYVRSAQEASIMHVKIPETLELNEK